MSMSYFKIIEYPSKVYFSPYDRSKCIVIKVSNYGEEAGTFHVKLVIDNEVIYISESITINSAEITDVYVCIDSTKVSEEGEYTARLQAFNEDNNKIDNEVLFELYVVEDYTEFKIIDYTSKVVTAPLQEFNITVKVRLTRGQDGYVVIKLMTANKSHTIESARYYLTSDEINEVTHTFTLTAPYTSESLLYALVLYNETNDIVDDEKYVFVYIVANRPIFRIKEVNISQELLVGPRISWSRAVAYPNERLVYSVVIQNIGDQDGTALILVKDESGAVIDSTSINIAKYGEGGAPVSITAPENAGTRLYTIEIYNVNVGGVDDKRAVSVRVLRFNTSIELIMPDRLKPSIKAWIYGRLKTSDGLKTIGLEGQEIRVIVNNVEHVVKTKVGGYFRLEITTMSSGILNITAIYDGQYKFDYMTSDGLRRGSIQLFYPSQTSKTITIDPNAPDQAKPTIIPEDITGEHVLTTLSNGFSMLYNVNTVGINAGFSDERGAPLGSPIPIKIYKNGQYYKDAEWFLVNIWDSVGVERLLTMISLVYEGSSVYSSFLFNMLVVDYTDADLPPEPEQPTTPPPPQQTKSLKIVNVDYPSTVRPNAEFNVSVSVKNLTSNTVNAVVSISEPVTYTSKSVELTLYANETKATVFTLVSGSREQSYTYTVAVVNKATGLTEDIYMFTVNVSARAPQQTPPTTTTPTTTKVFGIPLWIIIVIILLLIIGGGRRE
jgi:hypothetical protein